MEKQMLNGQWIMYKASDGEKIPVQVPGSVISGLMAAGKLEDPYYRENEYATRELFHHDYVFTCFFEADRKLLEREAVVLVCEGLDTLTEITLNGKVIAKTSDMHRTYRIPVKEYLEEMNQIEIRFFSVLQYIEHYPYRKNREIHYIPSGSMKGNELVRKGHSMFGWDWGPQLVDAGIFRDIYLEGYESRISDVRIHQEHGEDGTVRVTSFIQAETAEGRVPEGDITVTLEAPDGEEKLSCKAERTGDFTWEAVITVSDPKLWWPNGYGQQPLYTLTVERNHEQVTKKIGLRTLTVSQEEDEWGSEFAFCVNGLKIFTRGGNYIPEDAIYPNITVEKIDYLLQSCVRANFNCIRVWGGGYFPSDAFYDLCDKYGLIVWQDLMFACNVYDATDEFVENVRQETIDNVRRLRHHASLGLWCGNNEIESAWFHWEDFQRESAYLRADYIRLFEDVLPRAVEQTDPDTFYWHSSPSSGGCLDEPDDENRGDVHYWAVWHGQMPFTDYQNYYFRFCSEFGFQSFPCLKTVETYTKERDRNIFSKVMESHQKNDAANGKMVYYLSENLCYPKDFDSLLYATQVLQGIAIKSGVDHWRRNRGRCMGSLYWQINDNWPVASWSSIDYFGRWKALHYMAAKFYAPVAGSIRIADYVEFYLENETDQKLSYCGNLARKDFACRTLEAVQMEGTIEPFSSACVGRLKKEDIYSSFVTAMVSCGGNEIHETEVQAVYKHLELPKPSYEISVEETGDAFEIQVQTGCFAPFVELDFADADVIFSDNYFHLTGEPVKVTLLKTDVRKGIFESAYDLKKRLKVRSLRDSY